MTPRKRRSQKDRKIAAANMEVEMTMSSVVATAPTFHASEKSPAKNRTYNSIAEVHTTYMAASVPRPPEQTSAEEQRGNGWGHHAVSEFNSQYTFN